MNLRRITLTQKNGRNLLGINYNETKLVLRSK